MLAQVFVRRDDEIISVKSKELDSSPSTRQPKDIVPGDTVPSATVFYKWKEFKGIGYGLVTKLSLVGEGT